MRRQGAAECRIGEGVTTVPAALGLAAGAERSFAADMQNGQSSKNMPAVAGPMHETDRYADLIERMVFVLPHLNVRRA